MGRNPKDIDDFQGRWTLERAIQDRLADRTGHLAGEAVFAPDEAGLVYTETGQLSFPDQPPLSASQTYLWRRGDAGQACIQFQDGRAFHTIALTRTMPGADHICPPDFYNVTYDFTGWPRWRSIWRVRGPKKDYRMESAYTRL